jgi:hypothetical protein
MCHGSESEQIEEKDMTDTAARFASLRQFNASFIPHGINPDKLTPKTWALRAEDKSGAMKQAMELVGKKIGEQDFAYRDLADGSVTVLDTVCGTVKIGTIRIASSLTGPRRRIAA